MRFKLDENLPYELAEDLTRLGYDTDTADSEGLSGAEDATIVQAATSSGRVLMTLDKGIASLLKYPLNQHQGVVLFRPDSSGRRAVLTFVRSRLDSLLEMTLAGKLTVVGPNRIRVRS
jgi:predicted nuclease of predicted toxin-antitoxin system